MSICLIKFKIIFYRILKNYYRTQGMNLRNYIRKKYGQEELDRMMNKEENQCKAALHEGELWSDLSKKKVDIQQLKNK